MKVDLAPRYRDTALGREAATLLGPCVQCGQCTFVCPTFRLLEDEWDGPRGRIYLIKLLVEGKEPDAANLLPAYTLDSLEGRSLPSNLQFHLDRCLSCRSCESSCPQGVQYGRLLDIGRELVEKAAPRPLRERFARRALRAVVPHRRRFTALLRTGQALRTYLPETVRARIPQRRVSGPWPDRPHARRMLIWQGCVQPALAPEINAATARVLDRFGIRAIAASDGCCGALSHHMAATDEARAFMRKNIDALWPHVEAGVEALVITASGCGAHFRDYGRLLHDDPAYRDKAARISAFVKDIAEIIAAEWRDELLPEQPASQRPPRIVFQSSCSLQHGEKLNGVVEKLLKRAGFKLLPVSYGFMCCGAAGTYSLLQRTLSESLRANKLDALMASRPAAVATANIGCLAHLDAVSPVPVQHWIEMLDARLSGRVTRSRVAGVMDPAARHSSRALASGLIFLLAAHWPVSARAAHPLFTEDTGTQGAGRYQIELTRDRSRNTDDGVRTLARSSNAVFSAGLTDNLDFILSLPHERLIEKTGATKSTYSGYADTEIAAKWRFYEDGALSFALRPGLGLPTGDESEGMSAGHVSPSVFAVSSYERASWVFHVHVGYAPIRDRGPDEHGHVYHGSIAAEYHMNERLRVVSDASVERNTDRNGYPNIGSMVIGLVFSLTPNLDFDLGYRKGLTDPAPDHNWLTGLAFRF